MEVLNSVKFNKIVTQMDGRREKRKYRNLWLFLKYSRLPGILLKAGELGNEHTCA